MVSSRRQGAMRTTWPGHLLDQSSESDFWRHLRVWPSQASHSIVHMELITTDETAERVLYCGMKDHGCIIEAIFPILRSGSDPGPMIRKALGGNCVLRTSAEAVPFSPQYQQTKLPYQYY